MVVQLKPVFLTISLLVRIVRKTRFRLYYSGAIRTSTVKGVKTISTVWGTSLSHLSRNRIFLTDLVQKLTINKNRLYKYSISP